MYITVDEMKGQMMKQMMGMFGSMLPDPEEANNPVSEFLAEELKNMYPSDNELAPLITGVIVNMANADPQGTLKVLVSLHNDIGEFVQSIEVA